MTVMDCKRPAMTSTATSSARLSAVPGMPLRISCTGLAKTRGFSNMTMTPALTEHLSSVIPGIAAKLHRSYRQLDAEDIAQEMWAGALIKADRLETLLTSGDLGIISSELRRIGWRACKDDDRVRRAEKATAAGYSTDDEQFYTTGLLRLL